MKKVYSIRDRSKGRLIKSGMTKEEAIKEYKKYTTENCSSLNRQQVSIIEFSK